MSANSTEFVASWGPVRNQRQVLSCMHCRRSVGSLTVGLAALDSDPRTILVHYIDRDNDDRYGGGVVANWLIDTVTARWPGAVLRGGPLSNDDPRGPSFRLRTWGRGIEFHDGQCELIRSGLGDPPESCECLPRLRLKVGSKQELPQHRPA